MTVSPETLALIRQNLLSPNLHLGRGRGDADTPGEATARLRFWTRANPAGLLTQLVAVR